MAQDDQDRPTKATDAQDISLEELGSLKVPSNAQLQAQLNRPKPGPEKQAHIDKEWRNTSARVQDFLQQKQTASTAQQPQRETARQMERPASRQATDARHTERNGALSAQPFKDLRQVAQHQTPPREHGGGSRPQTSQQARGQSVFDRYSPQQQQTQNLRQVARNQTPAPQQAQGVAKAQQQERLAAQNLFDKHRQQRDKRKEQKQEKEQARGR